MQLALLFQTLEDGVRIRLFLMPSFKSVEINLHALSLLDGRVFYLITGTSLPYFC